MSFTLAIVGRPNVGKSTLFNRLVGKCLALVDDRPGVTRDLREGSARLGNLRFTVLDTAGFDEVDDNDLQRRMRRLTERAVEMADACLFMIDARAGVTPADRAFAEIVRKKNARVILAANKAEGRAGKDRIFEAYDLGLGDPVGLSAEHGEGLDDLMRALIPVADALAATSAAASGTETELEGLDEGNSHIQVAKRPLQIAIVGRPNAGKSTLVNRIVGEDRLLTGPEAGITRDAIALDTAWGGVPMRIFDTAGMRKKARIQDKLERLGVGDGLRAVRFAEVAIVLLDVEIPFEQQDLRIADLAEREGRAVVVAVNKWDTQGDRTARLRQLDEAFERLLPRLRGAALVAVSARTGQGLERLQQAVMKAHEIWNRRVSTAQLNRWLAEMLNQHPPPAPRGKRIKLRYMTQVRTRPPGFVVMCSHPDGLPDSYARYLINGLREDFDMPGTPIRLWFRWQGEQNPYRERKKSGPSRLRKHLDKKRGSRTRAK